MPEPVEQFIAVGNPQGQTGPVGVQWQQWDEGIHDAPVPQGFAAKARKWKPQKETSLIKDKVGDVFGIADPNRLTHEFADAFLKQQPQLADMSYVFTDPKALIGVEVEVENVLRIDPNITLGFWSIHEDGSLRNNGREFKTKPMPVQYLQPALKQLFTGLNTTIDFSNRTSIHYHMDIRHLTLAQIYGMAFVYAAVENLLFKFAAIERRKNVFCVPVTESLNIIRMAKDPVNFLYNIDQFWSKYSAFNLLPIRNFGTVEFRQMCGTDNITKLLIWADLLSQLKIYAYRFSMEEIVRQISALNTNSQYRQFVTGVFGRLTAYLDTSNLIQDMEKPVYVVKNCAVNNTFHQRVLNTIVKESNFLKLFAPATGLIASLTGRQLRCLKQLHNQYSHIAPRDAAEFYAWVLANSDAISQGISNRPFVQCLLDPSYLPTESLKFTYKTCHLTGL